MSPAVTSTLPRRCCTPSAWAAAPLAGATALGRHLMGERRGPRGAGSSFYQRGLGRRWLPLAACLAVGGRPCMGAGCGWPPLLLAILTAKA
ncbi:hypothetical protein GW17_00048825 [Ensete ventricosum]|nr:hypothetical protein GW17_00048825 [Ensete ventricosum]